MMIRLKLRSKRLLLKQPRNNAIRNITIAVKAFFV